jgi:hypothetical protein
VKDTQLKREINRARGFSRLDALVTIAVIAMVITTCFAAIVPSLDKARDAAMRMQCANQMRQMNEAIVMYTEDYAGLLPFYGGYDPNFPGNFYRAAARDELHPYAAYRGDKSPWAISTFTNPWTAVPMKMACLYKGGYVNDAKIFYCPANTDPSYQYESYITPLPPSNTSHEWGTLPQKFNANTNQWVRLGYAYFPIDDTLRLSNGGMTLVGGSYVPKYTARKYENLDRRCPYLTDVLWTRNDISHKSGIVKTTYSFILTNAGLNAVFKDGHVSFTKDGPVTFYNVGDDTPYEGALFDNEFWTAFDPPGNAMPNDGLDIRFLLYPIYKYMIKP